MKTHETIVLDGHGLTREQVARVAAGATVELDEKQLD